MFEVGDIVGCIHNKPFPDKEEAPKLKVGEKYMIKGITLDKEGNQHLDVGLISSLNWVTSIETGEVLPNSGIGGIHWCHPSRFIKV